MATVVDREEGSEAALLVLLYLEPCAVNRFFNHGIVKVLYPGDIDTAKTVLLNVRCEVFQVVLDLGQVFKLCKNFVSSIAKQLVVIVSEEQADSFIWTEEVFNPLASANHFTADLLIGHWFQHI